MEIGKFIELKIESLSSTGEGIATYEGVKVFVDGALIGELVEAEVSKVCKNYLKANLKKIIQRSPSRVEPICPHFEICGGCQIMHLSYDQQLQIKTDKVSNALVRIGKLDNIAVLPCTSSPEQLNYRNKVQMPLQSKAGKLQLGFYQKKSHDLVEVERCYIHTALGSQIYEFVKEKLKKSDYDSINHRGLLRHILIKSAPVNQQSLLIFVIFKPKDNLELNQLKILAKEVYQKFPELKGVLINKNSTRTNKILSDYYQTWLGDSFITEKILNLSFKISAASFFQVNAAQAANIYQKALDLANLTGNETVLDAYCGVGTLSLIFAQKVRKVWAVEVVVEAIENCRKNAQANKISNVNFECIKSENYFKNLPEVDLILLNPPRQGCMQEVLTQIIKHKVAKIIYISCDPATLARDLKLLVDGGYKIGVIQPFDMFPQTMHVETVTVLTRDVADGHENRKRFDRGN